MSKTLLVIIFFVGLFGGLVVGLLWGYSLAADTLMEELGAAAESS